MKQLHEKTISELGEKDYNCPDGNNPHHIYLDELKQWAIAIIKNIKNQYYEHMKRMSQEIYPLEIEDAHWIVEHGSIISFLKEKFELTEEDLK